MYYRIKNIGDYDLRRKLYSIYNYYGLDEAVVIS